ncbi:MAG: archaeosortase/exosortase family protein [Burkholderiales bacterium]|nr:archaeosortase/exosortase family protein [Burkholderiales bacterium]MDE2432577.1 archaeosortase/exosortase family protein [Burkholderiales bacterium]
MTKTGRSVCWFLGVFLLLQQAWEMARATWIEQWLIGQLTVGSLVQGIRWISPDLDVTRDGFRVVAPGGGLQVLPGCDGMEVWLLMTAALLTFGFTWRQRWMGLLAGSVWVFALNQVRLLVLFYAFRLAPSWFGTLHVLVAPLLLIVAVLGFFVVLMRWGPNRAA